MVRKKIKRGGGERCFYDRLERSLLGFLVITWYLWVMVGCAGRVGCWRYGAEALKMLYLRLLFSVPG